MDIKTTYQCFLCDKDISNENNSKEHIIPNSIGGRKTVTGFLCRDCNSQTGSTWDLALAQQTKPLCLFFRIKRQRNKVPSQVFQTTGDYQIELYADGSMRMPKPDINIQENNDGINFEIVARDKSELKNILKGIGNKYSIKDLEKSLEHAEVTKRYIQDKIHFPLIFGGLDAGRSLVKSALALVYTTEVDVRNCEHAINFLKLRQSEPCFGYYYEKDLLVSRPEGVPIHCVHITGKQDSNLIIGYIEYFGMFRIVMCLSSNYLGNAFSTTYCIDPATGQEIEVQIQLDLTLSDIRNIYSYENFNYDDFLSACDKVIKQTLKIQHEEEMQKVIKEAVEFAFLKCGAKEGEYLTKEQLSIFQSLLWQKLEPWVYNQISKGRIY